MRYDMLAQANSVCLLELSRSDRRVLAVLRARVDCAVLCCACGAKKTKKFREVGSPSKNFIKS